MAPESQSEHEITSKDAFYLKTALKCVPSTVLKDKSVQGNKDDLIRIAREFLSKACPEFLVVLDKQQPDMSPNEAVVSSEDRLVKVGRNIVATLRYDTLPSDDGKASRNPAEKTNASLQNLASECRALSGIIAGVSSAVEIAKKKGISIPAAVSSMENNLLPAVPHVRYGRTELSMPILTLGSMRFQQTWNRGPDPKKYVHSMDGVSKECQENILEILRYCIATGVNHIETAMGYGTSEMQIGEALKHMINNGEVRRDQLIVQTKGGLQPGMTKDKLKSSINGQLAKLQMDYIDLFSVHGLNVDYQYDLLFNNPEGNLIDALKELKAEGKVRHFGFSTHGRGDFIGKCIKTDAFDYINLHYHFVGSYTTSGDGPSGGNLDNVRLCHERDMGVFIISAFDKGGRLYAPSNKLRDLTLPDMEPMTYGCHWLWQHAQHHPEKLPLHTIVCGAARPSDLDQPIAAAHMLKTNAAQVTLGRERVQQRLEQAMVKELTEEWVKTWHVGVPNAYDALAGTQHGNIVWLYNVIHAYGLVGFALERYGVMDGRTSQWKDDKSKEENIAAMGIFFQWVPGTGVDVAKDYTADFKACPLENQKRLLEAIQFVHNVCKKDGIGEGGKVEWETAYDMRPWTAFPERP